MDKWADFVVVAVKYDSDHSRIVELEVMADNGETLNGTRQRQSKSVVVAANLRGTTYVTAYLRDGTWHKGEDVRVITVQGERFLRTDGNKVEADNLGKLPEYK